MGLGGAGLRPGARTLASILATVLLASACTRPPPEERHAPIPTAAPAPTTPTPAPPSEVTVAVSPPTTLDPAALDSPDSLLLAAQIFDGLVAYDPETLEVVPAAARRWEVDRSGRRFRFHLRRDARFHDGSAVRAQDFAFAWSRLADPVAANPYAFLLEAVEGFERYQRRPAVRELEGVAARTDWTLEVTLAEPWPDFVSLLGHPALSPVPPTADGRDFGTRPTGNGPYAVAAPLAPAAPLVLERFDRYAGATPMVERVAFRPFEDMVEAWPEFLTGEVDVAPVPPALLPDAAGRFGEEGFLTLARVLVCGLNESDPRFRDPAIREAVSLAMDREEVSTRVYGGISEPATAIVPRTIPGADGQACGEGCRRNLERARELARSMPRQARRFTLDYPASDVADRLAEALATQLRAAGIRAEPRPHGVREYERLLEAADHEMFCLVWVADYPRQQALLEPLLLEGSPENQARVDDRRLNRLLEEARATAEPRTKRDLYARAERRALSAMHVLPIVWFRSHLAVQPHVRGFALDPMGRFDAARLALEP